MKKSQKQSLKWGVIGLLAITIIYGGTNLIIGGSKQFNIRHVPETKSELVDGDRYVAGNPEIYHIDISPSLAKKMVKKNNAEWVVIGLVLAIGLVVFLIGYGQGWISFGAGSSAAGNIAFALSAASCACIIAAYSSAFTNNFVEISPTQYEQVKNDNKAIEQLFWDKKHYIR